jgi:hypothetical protein
MVRQTSIDYRGVGQSGYTAGRHEHDFALECEVQTRNVTYPRGSDEEQVQHDPPTDDRFTGRGGAIPADDDSTRD